ncbi:PilZ domain-containing protein [Acaryochloris sp. 'Moss Beach']|uniref:PilZ domain-containing protein n=1 Tax=Acaryochloris sp. 'Moss Beach' TaxID=2740837 RepID=UPI001F236A86|nr:PilZ domain-containing protein [Acaryochloris sp. 'Moss Beach']
MPPKPDLYEWFDLRRTVRLTLGDLKLWGITTMISEGGAEIALTQAGLPRHYFGESIQIEIQEENLCLQAVITQIQQREDDYPIVQLKFAEVTTPQYRRLVEMLFCRPGQWKSPQAPGELQSLYLLVKSFFTPRILFDRQMKISPVEVSKT